MNCRFKEGVTYRTQNGTRVEIVKVLARPADKDRLLVGVIKEIEGDELHTWSADGIFHRDGRRCCLDLVSDPLHAKRLAVSVTVGDDEQIVDVAYTFTPGYALRSYGDSPDPGADPEISLYSMRVAGALVPQWFERKAESAVHDAILEHEATSGPDPDAARDARIDDELMEKVL